MARAARSLRPTGRSNPAARAAFASMGTGPTISYASPVVAIGEAGGVVTSTITAVRNGVTGPLVVNLSRTGTATSGSDYAPGPTSVTILAGQNSVSFTSATITDDAVVEAAETIIETAQLAAYPLAVAVKTITITDNDVAGEAPAFINTFIRGTPFSQNIGPGLDPDAATVALLQSLNLTYNATSGLLSSTGIPA